MIYFYCNSIKAVLESPRSSLFLMTPAPLRQVSTHFLKAVVVLMGLLAITLSVVLFPHLWSGEGLWELSHARPVLIVGLTGIYLTLLPFLFALFQAFRLLRYIDRNNAFSLSSITALRNIKYCAFAMTILYYAAMPLAFVIADLDDAPGLVLIAFALACAPLVVATFAAVLQKLVYSAVELKNEHDFTV